MRTKAELIQSWLDKANKDLLAADHELSFSDAVTESVCFHCQQAVEKYLKAYMIFLGIPYAKTHEIGELMTKVESRDKQIAALKEEADSLTDYAIDVRYPDEIFVPSALDATEAHRIASRIKEYIETRIRPK